MRYISPTSDSRTPGTGRRLGIVCLAVVLSLSFMFIRDTPAQEVAGRVTLRSEKSPDLAFALSFFGSVVPAFVGYNVTGLGTGNKAGLVLLMLGVYVGPSLGHFYAGRPRRALTGIAIRSGVLLTMALALSQTGVCANGCHPEATADETLVVLAAIGLTVVSASWDVLAASGSAARTNREKAGLSIAPWLSRTGSPGLMATFRF